MTAKTFNTPLLTGRKAFGAVNKMTLTPAVNPQEKKLLKPQVTTYMNKKKTCWNEWNHLDSLDFFCG